MATTRTERDQELKALQQRFETSVAGLNRQLAEAEQIMEARDASLARYRTECATVSHALARYSDGESCTATAMVSHAGTATATVSQCRHSYSHGESMQAQLQPLP